MHDPRIIVALDVSTEHDLRELVKKIPNTQCRAKIANVDRKTRQISLSVRAMEEAEEKEALRNLNEASADEGEVGPTTIGELIKAQMEGRE
jgi:ribosomal protein S1